MVKFEMQRSSQGHFPKFLHPSASHVHLQLLQMEEILSPGQVPRPTHKSTSQNTPYIRV